MRKTRQGKNDATRDQEFSLKEVSAFPAAETPLFSAFPCLKEAVFRQGSGI
jgi:hypothetical protein